jgi:MoxR-like ATPase
VSDTNVDNAVDKLRKSLAQFVLTPSRMIIAVEHMMSLLASTYIWGAPGIGKTDIVRQIAKKRGARLCAIHLPQFDPADLKGIPIRMKDDSIRWMPSSYLPQQHEEFFDEFKDTRQIDFNFPFAEDLAVYLYNRENELIFCWNPTFGNSIDQRILEFRLYIRANRFR